MRANRVCLGLLLLTVTGRELPARAGEPAAPPRPGPGAAASGDAEVEPPPAPLQTEPEPEPAPLQPPTEPAAARATAPAQAHKTSPERGLRRLTGVAYGGVAVTVALITAGTVLGVLAQRRSDDLSRSTVQVIDGQPPIYDGAERDAFTALQSEGTAYNRATIACFVVAGITAVASGLLFWDASRLRPPESRLALRTLRPELALIAAPASSLPSGGVLSLRGRF
ncbi:MAG: hypothetical protein U1A78_32685 [Polyangia bacterium]